MKKYLFAALLLAGTLGAQAQMLPQPATEAIEVAVKRNQLNEGEIIRLRACARALIAQQSLPIVVAEQTEKFKKALEELHHTLCVSAIRIL